MAHLAGGYAAEHSTGQLLIAVPATVVGRCRWWAPSAAVAPPHSTTVCDCSRR
jgi:hypothetical protein